jgi:hypothetical protein
VITSWFVLAASHSLIPYLSILSFSAPVLNIGSGAAFLGGMAGEGNHYLPVVEALAFIVAGLAFDLSLTGGKFLLFIWRNIPIVGGAG